MELITKYDVFIPDEEIRIAMFQPETTQGKIESVLKLLKKSFDLGREAERRTELERKLAKEGGVVNAVNPKA